jgi:hypothetical protein
MPLCKGWDALTSLLSPCVRHTLLDECSPPLLGGKRRISVLSPIWVTRSRRFKSWWMVNDLIRAVQLLITSLL